MPSTLSRRDALRSAASIAALAGLSRTATAGSVPARAAQGGPSPIRLGIASYTFRKFDDAHLIEFAKRLRTPWLNLKDVHLKMATPTEVTSEANTYRDAGLKPTAIGTVTFNKNDDADIRAKFDYCKAAGVPVMVCAPTHELLPKLSTFAREYDIRLAIHNHGPEDKNFPSPFDVLASVKDLDPRVGLCIDVGHATRAGADVPTAIRKAGPRLFDVHMKDLADAHAKESQVAVGEGIIPVHAIFEALIDIRYPGYVDLEYEIFPENPLPGVLESFSYMRGVIAGMGYTT